MAGGAACLAVAVAAPVSGWSRNVGDRKGEIWLIGMGLLLAWLAIRLLRVEVKVSGGKLTVRSYIRSRVVSAREIRSITLQSKSMGEGGSHWIARVDLTDGRSFWLPDFDCGPTSRPPRAELAAAADDRALLGVKTDDILQA
jgi:hypothetical protein